DFTLGARQFLKSRPENQPFCLAINFNVPHSGGTLSMKQLPGDPELYKSRYRDVMNEFLLPDTYIAAEDIQTPKIPREVYSGRYIRSYDYVKTPDGLREQMVRVCQTITGVDRLVGEIRQELRRLNLDDNTIIIFSSDHGIQLGEHGLGGKVLLYDQSIRIPLIIYDPRLPASRRGQRVREFALSVDVAPTILSLTGVEAPSSMQGKDLTPLIQGQRIGWRQDFFCENLFSGQDYPRIEAVRSHEWKYIRYFKRTDPEDWISPALEPYSETLEASIKGEQPIYEELYHLRSDPNEERNLAGNRKYKAELDEFRGRIRILVREARAGGG
ncbi:MAG: sulfatase/phosphatase domain-containing protein, partial [Acidobacteriota bacterium]